MKPFLLILVFTFLISRNIFAGDIFIKAGSRVRDNTEINLISSDNLKTVIDVKLNGFYNTKVDLAGNLYDNISLQDFVSLGDEGQAALPTITKMIAIPNFKKVKVVINSSQFQTFESFDVLPYQLLPLRNTNGISNTLVKDNSYYTSNKYFPDNIVSIKEIAVMRDYRIAVVTINRVQYNPSKKQLKVYDMLGKEVAGLVNENLNPGSYNFDFNAANLTSGIYFYKLTTQDFSDIKKMTLLK